MRGESTKAIFSGRLRSAIAGEAKQRAGRGKGRAVQKDCKTVQVDSEMKTHAILLRHETPTRGL
jgi:hypothetical protein